MAGHNRDLETAPAALHTPFRRNIAGFAKTTPMVMIATSQLFGMRIACTNSQSITDGQARFSEHRRTWTHQLIMQSMSLCHIGKSYTPLGEIVLSAHHVSDFF